MASWGYRVGAAVIDGGFALLVGAFLVGFIVAGLTGGSAAAAGWAVTVGVFLVWQLNAVVIAARTNGQTLGKKAAGIRVVREDGRPYGVGTALLRDFVCRLLFFIPVFWVVDSLMPLGAKRQTLRDRMVSTRVVQEPAYRSRRWPLALAAATITVVWVGFVLASGTFREDGRTYTDHDRKAFIDGCSGQGFSRSRCGCAFDYISDRVPYGDYLASSRSRAWTPGVKRVVKDAFSRCAGGSVS